MTDWDMSYSKVNKSGSHNGQKNNATKKEHGFYSNWCVLKNTFIPPLEFGPSKLVE
jgi:hypothetical protein